MLEFLASNWLWIVLIGGFLLMHGAVGCGSHAGHGGHAGHGNQQAGEARSSAPADENPHAGHGPVPAPREPVPPGHRHGS